MSMAKVKVREKVRSKLNLKGLGKFFKREKKTVTIPEAFKIAYPAIRDGVTFLFAINPAYAYNWAINTNTYLIATALKKYEEAVRTEKTREMLDWLKIVVPLVILFIGMAMAFYIVVMALGGGAFKMPSIIPHTPSPAPTPPPGSKVV